MKLLLACSVAIVAFVAGLEGSKIIGPKPEQPSVQSLQQTIDRLQIELKAANDELSRQPDQSALLGQARWAKEELEFLQDRIKTLGLRLPTSSLEQAKNR